MQGFQIIFDQCLKLIIHEVMEGGNLPVSWSKYVKKYHKAPHNPLKLGFITATVGLVNQTRRRHCCFAKIGLRDALAKTLIERLTEAEF